MNTDYTKLSLQELRSLSADINETITAQKQMVEAINKELLHRFGGALFEKMEAANKTTGEISHEFDGIKLTLAVKPKVKWDNDALRSIASNLPIETVDKVFKIEFSVPERIYNALTDRDLVKVLNEARTVEIPEPKVSFSK